jgi:hypothetical protein
MTVPRRPFLIAGAVVISALIASVIGQGVNRARSHHEAAIMLRNGSQARALASRVVLPADFRATERFSKNQVCVIPNGVDIGCWLTPRSPSQSATVLRQALTSAGLPAKVPYCPSNPAASTDGVLMRPPTQICMVRAVRNGWDVDLVAFTKIVYTKARLATRNRPLVLPKPHVLGTEVVLSVEPH